MSRVESFLTVLPSCVLLCVASALVMSRRAEEALFGGAVAGVGLAWMIVAIITVAKSLSALQRGVDSNTE
jgi:Na+-transporting NADH:ubiquinone oxidoreductase subunit NqrD